MIGSLVLTCAFICLTFFAPNVATMEAGAVLIGVPWCVPLLFSQLAILTLRLRADIDIRGVFQVLPLTYIVEVLPLCLRGYMTTCVNLCMVTGQLIGSGILRAFSTRTDEWSYRIPLGLQWVWPVPIIILTFLAPQSPWWLVRHGRIEDAKKSLYQLTSRTCGIPFEADREISLIEATNEHEKFLSTSSSWADCFKGVNLRRTEIVVVAWIIQTFCGFGLVSYSVVFLQRAGLDEKDSFSFNIGIFGLGWIGTLGTLDYFICVSG
jgi:SP family general alpha glucoside:H+ symporter-like MFS transporter